MAELRRAERWAGRYDIERPDHLRLLFAEVGDDMDETDARWVKFERRQAQMVGLLASLLVSVCTGLILALIGRI